MKFFLFFILAIFGISSLPVQAQIISKDEKPILLAKKKKRKKRKKPPQAEEGETFGAEGSGEMDGSGTGVGIHRDHEGTDTPYWAEFGGLFSYSSITNGEGDTAIKNSSIGLGGDLYFLLGSIGVGPSISYQSTTSESSITTYEADGTTIKGTEKSEDKYTNIRIGAAGKFYLGNIDRDLNIFYGVIKVGYLLGDQTIGDAKAVKTTGSSIVIGGGLHLFLDSNIALTPEFTYDMMSNKADSDGAEEVKSTQITVAVGISTFI